MIAKDIVTAALRLVAIVFIFHCVKDGLIHPIYNPNISVAKSSGIAALGTLLGIILILLSDKISALVTPANSIDSASTLSKSDILGLGTILTGLYMTTQAIPKLSVGLYVYVNRSMEMFNTMGVHELKLSMLLDPALNIALGIALIVFAKPISIWLCAFLETEQQSSQKN